MYCFKGGDRYEYLETSFIMFVCRHFFWQVCGLTPQQQRILSGGAIGAAGGAAIGAISGGSPGTGALVGGAVGAVGGAIVHEMEKHNR